MKTDLALDAWVKSVPPSLDLTDEEQLRRILEVADDVDGALPAGIAPARNLESELVVEKDAWPLALHLVAKLVLSRRLVAALEGTCHLSVVFAVYKEHKRILTRDQHPHGENFLIRKIKQLEWLFKDQPHCTWELIMVDDGCPEGSGRIARDILADHPRRDRVQVLFLEEGIARGVPVTRPMQSTSESQKGGAIAYGMWQAVQQRHPGHIVAFTDADLSTHLGQIGLLLEGLTPRPGQPEAVAGGPGPNAFDAAIGSRRQPQSVVIKQGARNNRGKLFIYLWKRMLPPLQDIIDTQCGFKAFRADLVRTLLEDQQEKKFAIDIEFLLRAELNRAGSIVKVPVAWIDSDAASTTTELKPYLPMLQSIAGFYRRYLEAAEKADGVSGHAGGGEEGRRPADFARFIESLDEDQWQWLLDHIPQEITRREPLAFAEYDGVSVADLRSVLKEQV